MYSVLLKYVIISLLVRPRDRQKLLPPSRGYIGYIEPQDEGERDQVQERVEIFNNTFKQPGTE